MPIPLLEPGLYVSCQARDDNPLRGSNFMVAMARAAVQGGARAIRAEGLSDIRAIKKAVDVPIIGLWKREVETFEVYITPTFESAAAVARASADIIALDATNRPHPEGSISAFIQAVKYELDRPVFADVSTFKEGLAAAEAGADYVSTTMAGYTPHSEKTDGPDLELARDLAAALKVPVIAEGRFWTPEQLKQAFQLGVYGVVVGTAITNPREITKRFAAAVSEEIK